MKQEVVLLVEDSKIQKLANERILHKGGYVVINAGDGEEALRVAQDKIPDLILLDMLLPKLSGQEVLHALKEDARTAQIPVIVLSSLPQCNEAKLTEDGAASYFEKSRLVDDEFGEAAFLEMIAKVLSKASENKALAART